MTTRQRKWFRLRRLALPVLAAAYLGYFGFWAFHGSFGIWAKTRLETDAAGLQAELTDLRTERQMLEHRVALLRPESLDPDMLDEEARQALNLLRPDEIVIDGAMQHDTR